MSLSGNTLTPGGIALTAGCVCLLLGGCGGSSALSRTDFVAKADAICRESQQHFDRVQHRLPGTAAAAGRQASALVGIASQALSQLRSLKPPSDLTGAYQRYLDARQQALTFLEKGRDAAKRNDPQGYAQAKRDEGNTLARRLRLAHNLGLGVCGHPPVRLGSPAPR